jgi:TPR repeat protein
MKSKSLLFLAACLTAGTASIANAGEKPKPLPDQKQSDISEALKLCPSSLERFLPGDYYYCDAARQFWSGHDGSARESLKDAAAWANKPAQYALGIMYFNGDHAEKNRPLGLAWLALAAERHNPDYEPAFVDAYQRVSPEEMAQANAYWTQLKEKYADTVAAPRAKNRFDRAYNDIAMAVNFGGSIFIDGIAGMQMTDGVYGGDAAYGASGFSVGRFLQGREAVALAGWQSNVYVGDAQLVPIGEVINRSKKEAPQ